MRSLSGLVAVLVLSTACGGWDLGSTTLPGESTPTSLPTTTSTTPPSTTTLPSGPPVAWISPSGVPVAVTGVVGGVIEVLTPCGNPATLTEGTPIYEVDVVIDPGHGGPIDTGAVGSNGLEEKELNLRVGLRLHEILGGRGVATMLTRTGDYPVPIVTRAEYADRTRARALVSIHHNAPVANASEIPGVEVFVQQASPESQRLGGLLYEATMDALGRFDIEWSRAPDAGVMTVLNPEGLDAYGMVRRPEAPSALIELGYLANPAEAALYEDPAYVEAAATSLADSIVAFLDTEQVGTPLTEGRVFRPQSGVGADQCIEPDLMLSAQLAAG